jgi:tRNA U34 2-thiouridine synthase MnmA/TrmU
LIVEEQGKEKADSIELTDLRWVSWKPEEDQETPFECRTRSLSPRFSGTLKVKGNCGKFTFKKSQRALAEGQSLVLYRGEEVVGGGVMHTSSPLNVF